ncbi:MAG: neutral zinc metallopeptidase, partial [Thermomicrobiales bacterium]
MHSRSLLSIVIATAILMGTLLITPAAFAAQRDGPGSGVDGNTYTSPTFGYGVSWGETWTVIDETSEEGVDILGLSNEISTVYFTAYTSGAENEMDCLTTSADLLSQEAGVSDFRQAESGGDPLEGVATFGRWAVYDFDYATQRETVAFSAFLLCRALVSDEVMLQAVQIVDSASYNDELDGIVELFEAVTLPGDTPAQPDDPGQDDPGQDQPSGGSEVEDFLRLSAEDIDAYWARIYPTISGGQPYTPPAEYVMFSSEVASACGGASAGAMGAGSGPFYCPTDEMIYLDLLFAVDQADQFGAFPVAEAIAHEVGHHVQFELGMQTCDMSPCLDPSEVTSQELEIMADCFAGAWSQDAERRGRLGAFDIEANIVNYVIALGDHSSGAGDPGAHGRGALRVFWFLNGYYNGAENCLTASPATIEMVEQSKENAAVEEEVAEEEPNADPTEEPRTPGEAEEETAPGGPLAIEEPFEVGDVEITVTGTDASRTVAESGTRAEGTY